MARLSVIIPCYASGPFLPEALASLRSQTRRPDEVVVADDGSTDAATLAVLERIERSGEARVLRLPHAGPGEARNAAVQASTGELILPLDADDALAPRALEKLEAALLANPQAAFAFSHVAYFGAVRGAAVPPRFNPWLQLEDNKLVVTALLRRALFDQHGLRYAPSRVEGAGSAIGGYEDWSFWLGVGALGLSGVCVEEPLFRYRRRGGEGQLARDHARRDQLKAALRHRHPALYSDVSEAELRRRFAPGLELVMEVSPEADLAGALVMNQSLEDLAVRAAPPDARALLREARGKHLLWVPAQAAPLLRQARASLLEQLVRCLEAHPEHDALALPVDQESLLAGSVQPRLSSYQPARLQQKPGDLLLLRLQRAAGLSAVHLPEGAPPRALFEALVRRPGRALLFSEDFFGLVPVNASAGPASQARRTAPPDGAAIKTARRIYRRARRLAERLAGEERLGAILHPWKERLGELALRGESLRAALEAGELPRSLEPLLPPSHRMERRLLDAGPVRFSRRAPLVKPAGAKRALLVMPWITRGGVERAALEMLSALPRERLDWLCATSRESAHEWGGRLLARAGDLLLLGETTREADQPQAVLQALRDRQCDALVMVNSWLGLECARLARAALPGLRIADFQHTDFQTPGGDFAKQSCLRYDRFLDLRMVSTNYLRERYRVYGVDPAKVRVVRAGTDERAFNPDRVAPGLLERAGVPKGATTVGFIGRLVEDKDPVFVAQVYAALDRAAGPLWFVFVGDGPLRGAVEAELAQSGLLARTRFLPPQTEVAEALRDLSLVLMASRIEGLPLVFFEALAMRVPVVSTAIEGIPELVTSEVGACVANAKDPAERLRLLVEAAAPILRDPRLRERLGRNGRERIVRQFGAEKAKADYRAAFAELLRD